MPRLEVKPLCNPGLFVRIGFSFHSQGNLHNPLLLLLYFLTLVFSVISLLALNQPMSPLKLFVM